MQPVHCLRESSGRYIDNSHSLCHHHDHRLANFIINIQRSSWKTWYTAKCLSFSTTNFCYGKFGRCGCLLLLILKWKIWSMQLSFATNFAEKTFVGHDLVVKGEQEREREMKLNLWLKWHHIVLYCLQLSYWCLLFLYHKRKNFSLGETEDGTPKNSTINSEITVRERESQQILIQQQLFTNIRMRNYVTKLCKILWSYVNGWLGTFVSCSI